MSPEKNSYTTMRRTNIQNLTDIPNIGKAISRSLHQIGIQHPDDLVGKDPYQMYHELCHISGKRVDHCIIDVFIAAVAYMKGAAPKKWWAYTAERKEMMKMRAREKEP